MKVESPAAVAAGGSNRARIDRSVDRLGRLLSRPGSRRAVLAAPGLAVIATGVALTLFEGGYSLSAWYSAGLLLLALLALVVVLEPSNGGAWLPRLVVWSLGTYAAFVGFNFLSTLWADVPADAWAGANRALVFGLGLAIVMTRPWPKRAALAALALTGVGLLLVVVATLVSGALGEPLDLFIGGRLAESAGYANAAATLCLMGMFPLLYFAAAPVAGWLLRGLALGGVTALLQVALLAQSRGGAFALAVGVLLYLAISPQRFAALLCLLVAGGLTGIFFDTLTDLVRVSNQAAFEARLGDVGVTIALCTGAAAALGSAGAWLGGRLPLSTTAVRRGGKWAVAGMVGVALVVALAVIGDPVRWTEARWDDFRTSGYTEVEQGGNRFGGSLGSNRYDYYRVSLEEFERSPAVGIGSENFLVQYLERRRSNEAPHFPHSLAFRLLAQLGVVGTLLFVGFLAAAVAASVRAMRRGGPVGAGIVAAALATFAVWFAHGLVDWIWAFTGLSVVAFALLGVAARCCEEPLETPIGELAQSRSGGRPLLGLLGAGVALVLALSLILPGLAARYVAAAYDAYGAGSPDVALERLDRAADLDFLSAEPLIAKGVLARRSGRERVATGAFAEALRREPRNWFAHLELGMSLAESGRREAAATQLLEARRLNPRQPLVRRLLATVMRGERLDPVAVERELNSQLTDRLGALP